MREDLIKSAPTEPDAFLQWGAQPCREDGKFELSRGRVTGRSYGESRLHGRVCVNILRELTRTLDRELIDVGLSDFAVRTPFGIRSPDVLVDSGVRSRADLPASAPLFIAEVLSPSSVGRDFTEKVLEYTAVDTLQTYLICSQHEPRTWVWARRSNGSWSRLPVELVGREDVIPLGGLGIDLSMAAVFRGIPDAPTVE